MRFVILICGFLAFLGVPRAAEAAWEPVNSPTAAPLQFVVWGNGHWLAASTDINTSTSTLIHSENGVDWRADSAVLKVGNTNFPVGRMLFTGGKFLISTHYYLSDKVRWAASTDGITWEPFPVPEEWMIRDVVFAAGRWVCVGAVVNFAAALSPGEWTVDQSRVAEADLTRIIWFGERFHAFGSDSLGLLHYASSTPEPSGWTVQPRAPILISLGVLETGSIQKADGAVENAVVLGAENAQQFLVGRASPAGGILWTAHSRPGYGGIFPRKSADATAPGGFRHEWINPSPFSSDATKVGVFKLRETSETPGSEDLTTSLTVAAAGSGPDAMIAVGDGGLIRRYPTGVDAATAPVDLETEPAVHLKWSSRAGREYLIESSADGQTWDAPSAPLVGTGQAMTWMRPQEEPRRFFRVRERSTAASWEIVNSPTTDGLGAVAWGNGRWLAASTHWDGEKTTLIRSENGVDWRADSAAFQVEGVDFPVDRMFFTGGRFLACSYYFTNEPGVRWASSGDGVTWAPFPVPAGKTIQDVVFAEGRWVCVGDLGTFATATIPGEWTTISLHNSQNAISHMTRVIRFGGRFHAFGWNNEGLAHCASTNPDASAWEVRPRGPTPYALDSLGTAETGDILMADGVVDHVLVLTTGGPEFLVGRASPAGGITWTNYPRSGFGGLFPRRSADAAAPGGFRYEWVNPSLSLSDVTTVGVSHLREAIETPVREDLTTSLRAVAVASAPDAMIAVGDGGLIRRYPTGGEEATAPADLRIEPAIRLKWSSRAGHEYLIESSADGRTWSAWLPPLAGTGQTMTWMQPQDAPRRLFRVREQ